ncbi:MAG TPA: ATP-binding cassette domain-containing protein [Flavobacterium sp.]|jgi:phospholipid/cholesterol/gamma-HCH transport system ATP-binding protein|uniref:ABC transporter ATP-binding protein n=1 Tax=Flavobacterium sp. TaxID=239 RepID=UPI001B710CDB|nr:ATP-binding cassette domain-containing protein [Flavobacterium sp.]MBP6145926.1 ATP-binding cassette domain-containing protein [Flavobacterium sp.]MBP7181610.1 ATP-binding cassette domain-containing protein [Flavobacterium sp.]MBP7316959.1 ATP-binding cassette domain-containing protein [Flavobacterium sp.]HRL70395.1 ATP-binding cassette domain-containing protein [Flavobacterium sp.]HRM46688.1 ATP-binding cassette domain-containing protein [Flavobacterium sp.]
MKNDQIQHSINKEETVIAINGLYKSFGELNVLNGIDLTLHRGENIAVLGKSGSGKSVLIKIIAGLLKPDKGEVTVLGKQVHKLYGKELDELRLHIGFSFQSSALYDSMNVYQNLAFPLTMNVKNLSRKQVDNAVEEALDAVGLRDKIKELPADLSGGQRKRIGIARTLILKPEIMLYDEPTAGLDPITCAEINALIIEVQQQYKTTSVIITHDLNCAKNTCDRIAMLIDSKFLKVGKFEDVFNSDNEQVKNFFTYNFIQ